MRDNTSHARRLYGSFGIVLGLLLLLVAYSYNTFINLAQADAWNIHSYRVLLEIHAMSESMTNVESDVRAYLMSGNEDFLAAYRGDLVEFEGHLDRTLRLTSDRAEQTKRLSLLQSQKAVWVHSYLRPAVSLRRSNGDPTALKATNEAGVMARKRVTDAMRGVLGQMEATEDMLLARRVADVKKLRMRTFITLASGGLFSIAVALVLALMTASGAGRLAQANARLQEEVAERTRAEERLQQSVDELAASNSELEQFAYVASHDLQEPLRAIGGCVQVLQRRYQGKLDARADEFISHAVEGAVRMQNLINDLLSYSRVGTRGTPFARTDCSQVVDNVFQILRASIARSDARVSRDCLPVVMGDGTQLEQVFQNLVGNAIKFGGDKPVKVHIGCSRHGQMWVFSVKDDGMGIDSEYFERIFLMFQRLHTRAEYPGTGIGLAICKKIVERHGGRIWVESQVGQGSTFKFSIPVGDGNDSSRSDDSPN